MSRSKRSRSVDGKAAPRRHKAPGLLRFFTKQLLAFLLLAFIVIVIDFVLYMFIAYNESERYFNDGTPASTVRMIDSSLQPKDGSYTLSGESSQALNELNAWAQVVDADGSVIWSQNVPASIPDSYTASELAMAAHYATIDDYPVFFWNRGDDLLIVGFPKGSYLQFSLYYPTQTASNLPLYILLLFVVDLAVFFTVYFVSRRRTQRAVAPILNALDDLSEGRSATLKLKGDLGEIGEQITGTSAIIEQKDAARTNWIRGVSHDIRTPLSMILGYADVIVQDDKVPPEAREHAAIIRSQGLKIRDLVTDLNTASKLDYDMQPLDLQSVHVARLLRGIVTDHVNGGLDDRHPLVLSVADDAAEVVVLGDERLLRRAVENVISNARVHNETGCTTAISLSRRDGVDSLGTAIVRIADDGTGLSHTALVELEARLARARTAQTASGCTVGASGAEAGAEHGLGLVLVDRIVRAHHGHIVLSSEVGGGFAIELWLPLA